ncbi:MAG: 3-hydroxyacyl-CoA dehydrogenase family protein [Oscillospiraceae bacterium]|jgi:3-hydroxybutyryl-CoA dehydrogenase|nr:3-hydroxyacyl-CoA dehydrogenase family protein [Oscillospiraceae bacterium]
MIHKEVTKIGIIGMGMIGDSMSVLTSGHGYETVCVVRRPEMIPEYKETYNNYFKQMIDQKLMPASQTEICAKYVTYTTNYDDLSECEIIFECVTENLELKHNIYAQIEQKCPKVRAIASVSSSFVPDALAEKADKYKDRIIVAHPFNPAHMVPYFELCGTSGGGSENALQFAKEVLESLDRKPVILKKPAPGFIGNRLQFALWREALNLIESGICDPKDVDTCLNFSFCPRYTSIGIFEHFDNGGLKLNITTCDTVFPTLSNIDKAPAAITDRIERGDTGARADSKTGFYDWNGVDMDAYKERVNAPYWNFINWDLPCDK